MDQVTEGRKEVQRAAGLSVLAAAFLTILKLVTGFITNSLGILSEGLHSGLDFAAAGITLVAVRRASRAPDEDHLYGHGKIENFAAFAETIILWITSIWIILEALHRIEVENWPKSSIWGILIMAIGVIVTFSQSRTLYHAAEKHGSQALEADALHFRTDMISSVVVLMGLGFVWGGLPIADPIAAIGVAIIIFIVSARLGKRTFDALTDRAPAGLQEDIMQRVTEVKGVVDCIRVRARHSGPELFADIVVTIDEHIATAEAHLIAEEIEKKLVELAPRVDVVVHIEPAEGDISKFSEMNIYDQMQVIARRLPEVQSVHNVRVFEIDDCMDIAADLEMADDLTLEEAHSVSDTYEERLRDLVGSCINTVTLHLETIMTKDEGGDITMESSDIIESVKEIVARFSPPVNFRHAQIREEKEGVSVLLYCTIPGQITLTESHEHAEAIEKRIMEQLETVKSVFIHFDPV
ncbi:MAG: cation diffusion facilitator family transporter [Candidatus Thorarchaeota archaeon]